MKTNQVWDCKEIFKFFAILNKRLPKIIFLNLI